MRRLILLLLAVSALFVASCADDTPEVLSSNEQGASVVIAGQTYTFDISTAMCLFDGHTLNVQGAGTAADGRPFFIVAEGKSFTLAVGATDFNSAQTSLERWQANEIDYGSDLDTATATSDFVNPAGQTQVGTISVTC